MADAISRWKLNPVVDRVFSFDRVAEALSLMESGGHFGKIVLEFP
jgi:NADPH:quinone reductase-like Zn-dependent oxidoreductase